MATPQKRNKLGLLLGYTWLTKLVPGSGLVGLGSVAVKAGDAKAD